MQVYIRPRSQDDPICIRRVEVGKQTARLAASALQAATYDSEELPLKRFLCRPRRLLPMHINSGTLFPGTKKVVFTPLSLIYRDAYSEISTLLPEGKSRFESTSDSRVVVFHEVDSIMAHIVFHGIWTGMELLTEGASDRDKALATMRSVITFIETET